MRNSIVATFSSFPKWRARTHFAEPVFYSRDFKLPRVSCIFNLSPRRLSIILTRLLLKTVMQRSLKVRISRETVDSMLVKESSHHDGCNFKSRPVAFLARPRRRVSRAYYYREFYVAPKYRLPVAANGISRGPHYRKYCVDKYRAFVVTVDSLSRDLCFRATEDKASQYFDFDSDFDMSSACSINFT